MSLRRMPLMRVLCGWLVLLTIAFHGLIPVGFMPGITDDHSSPVITICGNGGLNFVIDAATGKKVPKPQNSSGHHAEAPCVFSLNSVFSFDGLQPPLPLPLYAFIAYTLLAAFTLRPAHRYGNASSRSPPLFS